MRILKETESSLGICDYKLVAKPELRNYLEGFEKKVMDCDSIRWPVVVKDVGQTPIPETLELKSTRAVELATIVRGSDILEVLWVKQSDKLPDKLYPKKVTAFNQDGMRAFAAICGTYILTTPNYTRGYAKHLNHEDILQLAKDTREFLGEHPLANLIHTPPDKNQQKLSPYLMLKVPKLTPTELREITKYNFQEVKSLLKGIPKDIDMVGPRDAPHHVVTAVMFILYVGQHKIGVFNPDSEEYMHYLFRTGLRKCLVYMEKKNIQDLGQLFEIASKAYLKNPTLYLNE